MLWDKFLRFLGIWQKIKSSWKNPPVPNSHFFFFFSSFFRTRKIYIFTLCTLSINNDHVTHKKSTGSQFAKLNPGIKKIPVKISLLRPSTSLINIIKVTGKQTNITQAYFHKRYLCDLMCLHHRNKINQVSRRKCNS